MKLTTTLAAPLLLALSTLTTTAHAQTFAYLFDGNRTNGIDGAITVQYDSPHSTRATIIAALDFSNVDTAAIIAADGNCSAVDIVNYKWHIHVKWSSSYTSEKLAQCGKPLTGNHYDPLRACGPFSEFIDTPECQAKIAKAPYGCNPEAYQKDPTVCEKGDLSGKGGDFRLDENNRVHVKWVDEHYPSVGENTPEWNIILHAVCGKATPRVACALGQAVVKLPSDWKWGGEYEHGYGKGDETYTPPPATTTYSPTPATTTHAPTYYANGLGKPYQGKTWSQTGTSGDAYPGNGPVGGY